MSTAVQAVSLLVDLLTASTNMLAQAQKVSTLIADAQREDREISSIEWRNLFDEDTQTELALVAAINREREKRNAKAPAQ